MTTKAKAKPASKKATPAKKSAEATPAEGPKSAVKTVSTGSCPSLSDTGVLEYEVGADDAGETHYRIVGNDATGYSPPGFFSKEWVAWSDIYAVCKGHDALTSIPFRGLFRGRSVNTAGFLVAALMDRGLLRRRAGKSRRYELTEEAHKQAPSDAA
ncbi:MAG: hypothetical protein ACQETO_05925 [Pseudomonadota bacterium]